MSRNCKVHAYVLAEAYPDDRPHKSPECDPNSSQPESLQPCPMSGMMVQVRIDVVSRTPLAAGSQAVKNFPAVLQALSARSLRLTNLSESLIADLADAIPAVTGANAAENAELLDLKVGIATRVLQI